MILRVLPTSRNQNLSGAARGADTRHDKSFKQASHTRTHNAHSVPISRFDLYLTPAAFVDNMYV